jgi:membrane protein DedA with SNARE-associated domain
LDAEAVARVRAWYDRGGKWLLVGGYFLPGVRHVSAILAGASKLSVGTFVLFAYAGAAIWASCFLTIGYAVGDHWRTLLADLHRHLRFSGFVLGVILAVYVYVRARRRA